MTILRETTIFPVGSIHLLDEQGDLLQRWLDQKGGALVSDDLEKIQSEICPNWMCHIVDASSDDADDYHFTHYDTKCKLPDLKGVSLGQFPQPEYAKNLKAIYKAVKTGHRSICSLETILSGEVRSFVRVINPLKFNGKSGNILIATRYQKIARKRHITKKFIPATCQKIKSTFFTIEKSFQWAISSGPILQFDGFKSVCVPRNTFIDNFLKCLTDYPVNTFFNRDRLGKSC